MTDSAGVRVPPPLIYLLALLVGIFGGRYLPGMLPRSPATIALGALLFAAGALLCFSAIRLFTVRGTNVSPNSPVTTIVADGPYRFTRNPMYIGLSCIYLAIALWSASLWACVLLIVVLLIIRYAVIAREERYLAAKFGDEYRAFTSRVRRWI